MVHFEESHISRIFNAYKRFVVGVDFIKTSRVFELLSNGEIQLQEDLHAKMNKNCASRSRKPQK